MPINSSEGNLKLLLTLRTRLFDALRDEDCSQKDRAAIALQFRKNEQDIAVLDGSLEQMKKQYDLLSRTRAILIDAVEHAEFTYLATLTRQLKEISKEVDTLAEQLKQEGGVLNGDANTGQNSHHGEFSLDDL